MRNTISLRDVVRRFSGNAAGVKAGLLAFFAVLAVWRAELWLRTGARCSRPRTTRTSRLSPPPQHR
jgi:hypothetical protein